MEYKDYYRILGVGKNADEQAIKKAYRTLAREYHPDRNPDNPAAEEKFKEINEAYEVLGDPEARRKYDQLGSNYFRYQQMGGDPGAYDFSQWFSQGGGQRINPEDLEDILGGSGAFSDFFTQVFGRTGGAQPLRRDTEQRIEISLEEAFHGTTRTLVDTSGDRFTVKIPAGIETGKRIRYRGKGAQGGDLLLKVFIRPHRLYERDGADLRSEVTVDVITAVLGGRVRVPTLHGDVNLTVRPGTQGGQLIRLRGRGMPRGKDRRSFGDLLAEVRIAIPTQLSAEQRELYEKLAALQ